MSVSDYVDVCFSGGGIIGVTEPRRVAAISMSKRVAEEMNLSSRYVLFLYSIYILLSDDDQGMGQRVCLWQ